MLTNLIFFVIVFPTLVWFVYRSKKNEPLLPDFLIQKLNRSKNIQEASQQPMSSRSRLRQAHSDKKKDFSFQQLVDLEDVRFMQMRLKRDRFVLVLKCEAVNYFLKSASEQEALDAAFEAALQIIDGEFAIYTQSRRVDYDELIQHQVEQIDSNSRLNDTMRAYCYHVIQSVDQWQQSVEIYDLHRYIMVFYDLPQKEKSKFQLEDEMYKRILTIQSRRVQGFIEALRRSGIRNIKICTDKEIWEMLYYAFHRKAGRKFKFDHVMKNEGLNLFVTSDRDEHQLALVEEVRKDVG